MPCRLVSAYAAAAPARASQRPKQSSSSTDVPLKTQLGFERHGHCVIRQSLPAESVQQLKRTVQEHAADKELTALQHRVRVLVSPKAAASCRDMADAKRLLAQHRVSVGFLQFFNLHRYKLAEEYWMHCFPDYHLAGVVLHVCSSLRCIAAHLPCG